jgi:putative colanic acid biosynthesis acetyltransferase WcaF
LAQTQLHKNFDTGGYQIGASIIKQLIWYFTDIIFFKSRIVPISAILVFILKVFGAKIGKDVRIKPGIHVKFPWKLEIGNNSWLADCYLENLDWIRIGSNCCISQQAMLMTGNHDYSKAGFDLITKPIILEEGVWIGAASKIAPGLTLYSHSVLTMGSTATKNLDAYSIYQGIPAVKIKNRIIS